MGNKAFAPLQHKEEEQEEEHQSSLHGALCTVHVLYGLNYERYARVPR